ncbi:TonB-dependent siderophore receptor [Pseudomonas typographi]|uniref:TonB-dependent siderophore receptor n=1 Tax=Pseudomonas typographi TaxID=2715964 RepID=UPI0016847918|nr:TonB-dependent siderophore receptor [Pseudomonas typographi]MBD1588939.1 TonB-dependent siderophore receptor [Pseudomonas typographi]
MPPRLPTPALLPLLVASTLLHVASAHAAQADAEGKTPVVELETQNIVATAEQETKQAPGVSIITAEDIKKRPPANDISELIRTMPGVNLTGNSSSGQRGNNRQIDIRGMGPENTLILIDGKPVTSRSSVRYGWRGERDSRGDTNWVPADMIERIEVIRGPAAARYGNGAAGGVVNIITQQPTQQTHGSATVYTAFPQHKDEGATRRMDFGLRGAMTDNLTYRLYGNVAKTDADDWDINSGHESARTGNQAGTLPAGREGVRNKDVNGLLAWQFTPEQRLEFEAGYSRQSNLYTGDTQNTNSNTYVKSLLGHETNILYRNTWALTHRGDWDFGTTLAYLQYEKTRNRRINEGLAGGTEGIFSNTDFYTSTLRGLTAHGEVNLPLHWGVDQTLTLGSEWVEQRLDDPLANTQSTSAGGTVSGISATQRDSSSSARIASLFAEDNIELRPGTMLTPALRFDHHDIVGDNWSPSLNLSQVLTDTLTLKAGIARAYKAPNLYQLNPNYLLYSNGQGCYGQTTACYLQGNAGLKAETSVNKELGIEYKKNDLVAGLTYFRNDYKNKIESGLEPVGTAIGGTGSTANASVFQWENVPKALVEGLEGNFSMGLAHNLKWSNNFTYMLQSKNKQTGDVLSVTPRYTLNSMLGWQATDTLSLQLNVAYYGKQKPKKYDYHGARVTGTANQEVAPYAIVGSSGTYQLTQNLSVTAGIDNLLDKRHWREGNAQGVTNIAGAGAATYNEPGRTLYTSVTAAF